MASLEHKTSDTVLRRLVGKHRAKSRVLKSTHLEELESSQIICSLATTSRTFRCPDTLYVLLNFHVTESLCAIITLHEGCRQPSLSLCTVTLFYGLQNFVARS